VTTFPARTTGTTAGRPPRMSAARPASGWAFAGVAVTSFGGPLALAALYATMPRLPATAQRDSFPRRSARLLLRGPAGLTSPAARWAVTLLAVAGAGLLVWSGVIHLQLWSDGYRSVIGPLFLIQGIASIVLAVALAVFRRLVLLAAGAVLAVATAAGLLLSAGIGLFGYVESLAVPYAETSLVVEFTSAAVLAAAAAIVLAAPLLRRRS
jgi:hypothetical protein